MQGIASNTCVSLGSSKRIWRFWWCCVVLCECLLESLSSVWNTVCFNSASKQNLIRNVNSFEISYELFHIIVDKMQELWEEGNEKTASQVEILKSLNTQVDVQVICLCKPEVWTYGKKEKTHKIQNNVNQLEKSCQCV